MTPLRRVDCRIEQRVLVNVRVDPDVAARLVPAPFRPRLVDGAAVAGICLLWLDAIRPAGFPARTGLRSANAAHRIAVEWSDGPGPGHGVFILRHRHTDSTPTALAGGRLFPGVHERAHLSRTTGPDRLEVHLTDAADEVALAGPIVDRMPPGSVFPDVEAATAFFARDSLGWSAGYRAGTLEGVELVAERFELVPLGVEAMRSTFFSERFPPGSTRFDSALLMRPTPAHWHAHPPWRLPAPIPA
ncbi:DUF2071 domain-containing protein [Cryptosporangium phraense]|uniref:DUF2071 domain-containing protein n=1 Tax=Cryptosporangium phraense TaxID=2593070 RepID=A0A545AV65_9ACTN|nr:DUF2071 domain-containing protein [Cryptosporangium phraense]TQS45227.1 hypothetical protein FL583_08980 [Cryptosporangium phraense]